MTHIYLMKLLNQNHEVKFGLYLYLEKNSASNSYISNQKPWFNNKVEFDDPIQAIQDMISK